MYLLIRNFEQPYRHYIILIIVINDITLTFSIATMRRKLRRYLRKDTTRKYSVLNKRDSLFTSTIESGTPCT